MKFDKAGSVFGMKQFKNAARNKKMPQCLQCGKYVETLKKRHSPTKCRGLQRNAYNFPNIDGIRICLLCCELFGERDTQKLIDHYGSEHGP